MSIQSRLTDVRYELESYMSQLKVYDNQVDYDTVNISIQEVKNETPTGELSIGQKMLNGLENSLRAIAESAKNLCIWFVASIPYFVILFAVIFAVVSIIEWHEGENKLEIRNLYTVPGNVDAATGNIRFNGDVNIMGNVTSGFSVQAAGNIVIDGHCEASQIEAGGDVIIRKGCQGKGLGKIIAGKSIVGQFFESAVLTAGKDVQATYLLNCQLKANGKLLVEGRKGVIIGGKTCAKLGVSCNGIGNIAEIATVVSVGIDKEDMTAYQELQKKIEQTQAELQTCENGLNKLMANPVHDEKVSMMIQRLTRAVYTLKSSRKELFSERDAQMEQMTKQKEARIQVSGRVYPGTLLFLNEDPFAIKEIYNNVEFVKHDNRIDTLAH